MASGQLFKSIRTLSALLFLASFAAGAAKAQQASDKTPPWARPGSPIPSGVVQSTPPRLDPLNPQVRQNTLDELRLMRGQATIPVVEHKAVPPVKRNEIKCGIVDWDRKASKPILTLVCPPVQVFAPLHVYLKFSWHKVEDSPKYLSKIVAPTRGQTKLVQSQKEVTILLKVGEREDSEDGNPTWVSFNEFVGLGLQGE